MKTRTANGHLRNLARGGGNYRHLRWRVYSALNESASTPLCSLGAYLAPKFFSLSDTTGGQIRRAPLPVLPLMKKDWFIIERLNDDSRASTEQAYSQLLADYLIYNSLEIDNLRAYEYKVSNIVLNLDDDLSKIYSILNDTDRQSLFAFRLFSALNSEKYQNIVDYFAQNTHSEWVKQILLYPLIFKAINLPDDEGLLSFIDQVFHNTNGGQLERNIIYTLLSIRDTKPKLNRSSFYYLCLICHPFDALNMIIDYTEVKIANNEVFNDNERVFLKTLSDGLNDDRLKHIVCQLDRTQFSFAIDPVDIPIAKKLALNEKPLAFLRDFIAINNTSTEAETWSGLWLILKNLRWSRYPNEEDFTTAISVMRRYDFCELGRFLDVLLTSIYMLERKDEACEIIRLNRQMIYWGCLTPFTLCSPSGGSLKRHIFDENAKVAINKAFSKIDIKIDNSRLWIKILHWRMYELEGSMKIQEWFSEVRENIVISGNSRYLSGINWKWLDKVISESKIRYFSGNIDGIYVLLLRAVEERQREPNILRHSLRPFLSELDGMRDFVSWLMKTFSNNTLAFVRFFLTPATILKMQLETSYTAALSERINALERSEQKFGLNTDIMTSEQFRQELSTLTSALTFMTVGAAQFEISWTAFETEATANSDDEFKAHEAFNRSYNQLSALTDAKRLLSHKFSNGRIVQYELKNRHTPLVTVIFSIVDTFLSHPSNGIEAILAIRIRHDNLRRELSAALTEVQGINNLAINNKTKRELIANLDNVMQSFLQPWIDRYMHTCRVDNSPSVFEFIPSQVEMDYLIDSIDPKSAHVEIVEHVSYWLKQRLDENLLLARKKLNDELKPDLLQALEQSVNDNSYKYNLSQHNTLRLRYVATSAINNKLIELEQWFYPLSEPRKQSLTFAEMNNAVAGRFQLEISSQKLSLRFYSRLLKESVISPHEIRGVFDLWSELTTNALKYSGLKTTVLRIKDKTIGNSSGLLFSSRRNGGDKGEEDYIGEPNTLADERVLMSGKSGFSKIAALASAFNNCNSKIIVYRRPHGFHVFVPICRNFDCDKQ